MSGEVQKVYFAACRGYGEEELDRALDEVLEAFDFSGKRVLVKPNLLSFKGDGDPASVHPRLLCAAVRLLFRRGAAAVTVSENPGTQELDGVIRAMGIADELKKSGAEISPFRSYEVIPPAEDSSYRRIELAADWKNYDLVLNLAKAKTHCMMSVTLAVKNLFGLVRSVERLAWHLAIGRSYPRFADMLLDLYLAVKPQVNLVDAVMCMEGNGPGNGTPVAGDFLAASGDALALDAVLSEKVFMVPESVNPVIGRARSRGLLPETEISGELPEPVRLELPPVSEERTPFDGFLPLFVQRVLRKHLVNYPVLNAGRCLGCGLCARVCPPKSLEFADKMPKFNLKSCIRCYCCQEHCPAGAIVAKQPLLLRLALFSERTIRNIADKTVCRFCFSRSGRRH